MAEEKQTQADKNGPAPVMKRGPGRFLLALATLALAAEIALAALLGIRLNQERRLAALVEKSTAAQAQAAEIRGAWDELSSQGAVFRARLAKDGGDAEDVKRHVRESAGEHGVDARLKGPRRLSSERGLKVWEYQVNAAGREKGMLDFMLALERAPALVSIEKFDLRGTDKGRVSLKLFLRHYRVSAWHAARLRKFVEKLPQGAPVARASGQFSRQDPLFLPVVATREEAMRGWPRIALQGFSEDKALMLVDGQSRSFNVGDAITDEVTYAGKPTVNQATLKRSSDHAEIILTVGSSRFTVKPSEIRGMNSFMLILQRKPRSSLLAGAKGK